MAISKYRPPVVIPDIEGIPKAAQAQLQNFLRLTFNQLAEDLSTVTRNDASTVALTDTRIDIPASAKRRISPPLAGSIAILEAPSSANAGAEIVIFLENPRGTLTIVSAPGIDDTGNVSQATINKARQETYSTSGTITLRSNGVNNWSTASQFSAESIAANPGAAGPTGATGLAGSNGKQGPQGIPGNDGADGFPGQDGTNGLNGVPGQQGVPGPAGIPGSDGIDGRDGVDGLNGLVGPVGSTGPQGIPGNDGLDGAAGSDGQDGLPGSPGVAGATGATGPQGIPGNDGLDGAAGNDGQDGLPGSPGVAGATGASGSNGAPGTFGSDGNEGTEGLQGMPGPAGPPGTIPPTRGIVLNTTSMKLQVITTTTAAMAFETNYTDFLPGIFTPGHTEATSASAVTTDIVPVPAAANIQRVIHELTILNTDTTFSQVVSVQLAPAPTLVLTSINLGPGERIEYTSDRGFRVFQSNGAEKSALVPAGFSLTGEVTTVGNVATVTRSTDYDTMPWTGPHAFSDTVRGVTRLAQTMSANVNDLDVTSVTATSQAPTAFGFLLTGMIAVGEGQWVWIQNNQTIRTFSIAHQNSGSVAANRFRCPGGVDYIVPPQSGVWARYSVGFWALASLRANSMIKRTMVQTPGAFSVTLDINTSWFTAEWVGGGGGSGGVVAATSGEFCASGGGGAGGYCKTINIFVPGATAVTGTLGALGAGGSSAGGDGGTGGTTTVTYNAVSTIATGGAGGKGQTNGAGQAAATTYGQITAGGSGGAAGTSVFGTNGGDGHPAFMWGVNGNAGVGAAMAGNGGGSFFGSGGFGAIFVGVGTSAGGTAQAYGSGGGGSCASSSGGSNAVGGAPGAQAVIIIEEFSGTTPTEAVV